MQRKASPGDSTVKKASREVLLSKGKGRLGRRLGKFNLTRAGRLGIVSLAEAKRC